MKSKNEGKAIAKGIRIFAGIMCVPSAYLMFCGVFNISWLIRSLTELENYSQGTAFSNYHIAVIKTSSAILFVGGFAVFALISYINITRKKCEWFKKAYVSSVLVAIAGLIVIIKLQVAALIISAVYAVAAVVFKLSLKSKEGS